MQSLGIALTNRSLLPFGNDHVAAMGIVMKVNMIAVLILVGFAFGGQPLIGYNYGAKNRRRLKEILSFAYKFECGLALLLTILLSLAARPMIRIFMKDNTIVSLAFRCSECSCSVWCSWRLFWSPPVHSSPQVWQETRFCYRSAARE